MALTVDMPPESLIRAPPEILSDERIEELLKEAEARVRQKAGLKPQTDDVLALDKDKPAATSSKTVHLPKLEHNLERSSYLKNHNGIAKTNPSLMVPAEQRKMAEGLRAVTRENGESKKVVCLSLAYFIPNMRKIQSQILLDAHQHLILRLPCFHESLYQNHSYSDSNLLL